MAFSTPVSVSGGIWIENDTKPDVVWRLAEGAAEGAGLTTSFTSSKWGKAVNVGTGKHGGLTIEGGVYYFPSELWIGNGEANSYFTINGGIFTNNSYTCIGYGGYDRTGTMTVDGGTYRQNSNTFIVGQGNHSGCKGVFNLVSGSVDTAANATCSENQGTSEMNISGGSFKVGGQLMLAEGRSGTATTTMNITGGSIKVVGFSRAAVGSNSSATITMSDGTFDTDNEFVLASGTGSTAVMTLSGGTFTPKKFWVGSHHSYTSSGCNATFTMTGGTLRTDNDQDIVVGGNGNAVGTFNMQGGAVNCGNTFHIAWNGSGTLNMSGGDIYLRSGKNLYFAEHGTSATMNFTGGTVHTDNIVMGTGDSGTAETSLSVNGGFFAPVSDQSNWLSEIPMTVGANGIGFDTAGHAATFAGTLAVADGVEGNFPIMKKGLGTLTIPSDLDLERTFKFTIDTDLGEAGVGPIALTGTNNTLAAGKKITVDVRPENLITETYYPLITGLTNEITMASIEITGDTFFVYTGKIENGTLSVSASLPPGAPAKARYVGEAWKFYDKDGNALPAETEESIHTYYVFTGAEPVADLLAKASTNKIMLEAAKSGGNAVTNTIAIPSDFAPKYLAIETEEGCAVALSGDFVFTPVKFANRGTLIFGGEITLSGIVDYPFSIAEGALVTLVTPQTIGGEISGTGTLALTGGTYGYLKTDETTVLDGFEGTLVVRAGAQFDTQYNRRGNPDKFHIMLGKARVRLEGATMTVPADNEAYIYNEIEIKTGTVNVISGTITALCIDGKLTGGGTVTLRCPSNRGGRIRGDSSEFSGTCIIENVFGANGGDEGIQGANAGSASATWVFPADGVCSELYKKTYLLNAQDATMYLGAFQQTGPKAYVNVGTSGTTVQVGDLSKGESVIEGQFTNNPLTLKKVGADSWLTLGTNFAMVAGSTLDVTSGGLALNLPEGETLPDLTEDTVTIDSSVTVRVNMTSEQRANLNLQRRHLLAKLPADFDASLKVGCEIAVDGIVQHDDPHLSSWAIRFRRVAQSGDDPAYVEMSLVKLGGLIIMFQ